MLYHSLDGHEDNPLKYAWTMIFEDHEALLAHLTNPKVTVFLMQLGEFLEGGLEEGFRIEVWGDIGDETRASIDGMLAMMPAPLNVLYFPKKLGFTPALMKADGSDEDSGDD